MKNSKQIILVALCIGFVTLGYSQRKNYKIQNGIGFQGGITEFDIITDNFETKSNTGYIGGMAASVDLPHRWFNVSYNMQLSENQIDINASPFASLEEEFVTYKMLAVNVSFLFHIKLISNNLTLDVGPMLQYNSKLSLTDDEKEDYIISGYDSLLTQDLRDVTRFNANGVIGLSLGVRRFLLRAQYIYGFTNILGNLNNQDLNLGTNQKFEGNQTLIALTAIITL